MRLLFSMKMQWRVRRTLNRMRKLIDRYEAEVLHGSIDEAASIHNEILAVDRQVNILLSKWDNAIARRRAVRS